MSLGIKALNLMYNQQEDIFYCLLDAPNKQAVENYHNKHGFKCDWITEVRTTLNYSNNLMTGRGHYITSSSEGGQFQKITHRSQ